MARWRLEVEVKAREERNASACQVWLVKVGLYISRVKGTRVEGSGHGKGE